jgi:hypothetical protein
LKRGERLGEIKNHFGRNSVSFNSGGRRGTGGGKCDFVSLIKYTVNMTRQENICLEVF